MSDENSPKAAEPLKLGPFVGFNKFAKPSAAMALNLQRAPQPVSGRMGSLNLSFESNGVQRPDFYAVSSFSPNAAMGINVPFEGGNSGMASGSMVINGQSTWFTGLYQTVDLGGLRIGAYGGRMTDLVTQANGIARKDNDRFMYGVYASLDRPDYGVEAKCIDSRKDNIPPVCGVSYKFKF